MDERTALLIDGANMFATTKALGFSIDYRKLLDYLERDYRIVRANYYTAVRVMPEGEQDTLVPLLDWLAYNGYKVVTKDMMEYANPNGGRPIRKGNMDMEMAVDALCMSENINHFIIGSGDGDFTYLVDCLHRRGLAATALSTIRTDPPMIAATLRREVDEFIDIGDPKIREFIERR